MDRVVSRRERGRRFVSRQPHLSIARVRIERFRSSRQWRWRESGSITAGFQAGYDYQIGSIVPGFETDFNYLSNCRNGTFAAPPVYAPVGIGTYSLSGGCSVVILGRSAPASAMLSIGRSSMRRRASPMAARDPGFCQSQPAAFGNSFAGSWSNSARTKYVFGVGLEYALSDHWFAKAEYLYADLGRIDQFFLNGGGQGYTSSQFNQNHIFRMGLDYKFDAGAILRRTPSRRIRRGDSGRRAI